MCLLGSLRLSVTELQNLNHLRDDAIFEGDVLAVHPGKSPTPSPLDLPSSDRLYVVQIIVPLTCI